MRRLRTVQLAIASLVCAAALHGPAFSQDADAPAQIPKGTVLLRAVEGQPIGMDPKDVEAFLVDDLGTAMTEDKARWKKLWEEKYHQLDFL